MSLSVAIQMDPIETVDVHADSTFHLAMEAQSRGHSLFYYHVPDLSWQGGRVTATGWDLEVRRDQGDHFMLGPRRRVDLAELD
ncbi:MAG: glutathione synthase, partial [Pseudomonadota bacterium]